MLHSDAMPELLRSILEQVRLTTVIDIGLTALLIYWLFSLIRGTRAVRLVIGVSVLFIVYVLAVALGPAPADPDPRRPGAVVGLFALVVVFQPELRRALERIGRVGSFGWLLSPAESRAVGHVAAEVAKAAAGLSADGHGALIVLERETGLEEVAETGRHDPRRRLRRPPADDLRARGPRSTTARSSSAARRSSPPGRRCRWPTRRSTRSGSGRATGRPSASPSRPTPSSIVVSEENGQISLVERTRIVRNLNEPQLARAIRTLLDPNHGRRSAFVWRPGGDTAGTAGRSPRLRDLGRSGTRGRHRSSRLRRAHLPTTHP